MSSESEFKWVTVNNKDDLESFYISIIQRIKEVSKSLGYAIAVHGSMRRDLDLIAIPWNCDAENKDNLATKIQETSCGLSSKSYQWEEKPLGRVATCFPICFPSWESEEKSLGHIDLSVFEPSRIIDNLQKQNEIMRDCLEKIADPRKRDHTESDAYTRYCCVMNIANECLEKCKDLK